MQLDVTISELMEALIQAFGQYMLKNLGLHLEPKSWKGDGAVPFFLKDAYVFYMISLLGKNCLLVVPREIDSVTPAVVRKHLLLLREISRLPCIYLAPAISPHNRLRLVKHGVQFVIPGRQIYLPALGVDWIERCPNSQKHRTTFNKQLSPSSQALVIYAISHHKKEFMPLELARALNYTPMTMTRALNELELFNVGKTDRMGHKRLIRFPQDASKIWKQCLPFFQNPIKKRIYLKLDKQGLNEIKRHGFLAGLSALAEISMLTDPPLQIYAVGLQTWKSLQKSRHIQIVPDSDEADIEIEVWSYEPSLFAKEGRVDSFSLYLTLKNDADERVETALESMWEGIKW